MGGAIHTRLYSYELVKPLQVAGVIKFWGPHENRDPGSLPSYEYGDSLVNLGTPPPQLYDA